MGKVASKLISVQEFLNMEVEENYTYELINGKIVKKSAPHPNHQRVSKELLILLDSYVKKKKLGEVLNAPLDVFFDEYNVVQPDLLFVSEKKKEIITENGVEGAPDLVIEILSPGSMRFDRGEKMKLYKKYQVQEYWIVDPKNQSVEVYVYENNEYELFSFAVEAGKVESKVLQKFSLPVEKIF